MDDWQKMSTSAWSAYTLNMKTNWFPPNQLKLSPEAIYLSILRQRIATCKIKKLKKSEVPLEHLDPQPSQWLSQDIIK